MIRKRVRPYRYGNRWATKSWNNVLTDVPCFIIGNGPSIEENDLKIIGDSFSIGINRAFLKIDPTILMWQDIQTWYTEKKRILRTKAIKFCRDTAETEGICHHFRLGSGDYKMPKDPSRLQGRGSTGPLAFQLAYLLGCNPIVLVGMDCCYRNGKTDFYGINKFHSSNTLKNCNHGLKWILTFSDQRKIINCSENNVFKNKYSLVEAIQEIGEKKQPRDVLYKKILSPKK